MPRHLGNCSKSSHSVLVWVSMNLVIVADWLPTFGGAEHVLAALANIWPSAPIFTTVARPVALGPLRGADLRTDSFLQRLFCFFERHQMLLPLMPRAMESMNLDAYDIVLSSSHAVGKGVIPSSRSVHVCYCHTPARYAWEMEDEYLADFRIRGPLKWLVRRELKKLRRWDLSTAKRVDQFIANSTETQRRIREIYGRDSVVVHPPVDDRFFETNFPPSLPVRQAGTFHLPPSTYFLALGRLVPYKRFDLLIDLANRLQLPLKIAGVGSDLKRLKRLAGPTVEFLGFVSEADLPQLYAKSSCLLFPQVEDAGIVPLEAQASGVPVIAFGKGGVCDVIIDGETGILVSEQTVDAFAAGIKRFWKKSWDQERIRKNAERFRLSVFQEKMKAEVERVVEKYRMQ